mgnify:CR=1 FL=1
MVRPHKHILFDATITNPPRDEQAMKDFLSELIVSIDMTVASLTNGQSNPIAWYCDELDNEGMTASAILTTSHVVLHVWDQVEKPELHFDLYSCSDFDPDFVVKKIHDLFGIVEGGGQIIDRRGKDIHKFFILDGRTYTIMNDEDLPD